mmetsp:Transcript_97276/g.172180  ORF Transcript_97276/g.172180 Transcript_97276/m.172180 type:complete len:213 (+) Transcript_97276:75-713(+)
MCDTRLHSHVAFVRNWLSEVARPIADLRAKELHTQSGNSRVEALLPRDMLLCLRADDDMELGMDDMERLLSDVRAKVLSLHKSAPSECKSNVLPNANLCLETDANVCLETGIRSRNCCTSPVHAELVEADFLPQLLCEKQVQPHKSSEQMGCKLMAAAWSGQQAHVQWDAKPPMVAHKLNKTKTNGRPRVGKFHRLACEIVDKLQLPEGYES